MKTKHFILLALMAVFCLTSCDKNKSQIEEKTKAFAEALKTNDVATIYDIYPDARKVTNMKLPGGIQMADIEVVKDEATGNYIATIKNPRAQKLVFKVIGEGKYQIIDSYSLFDIDKDFTDLAVKTGIPLKTLSDLELNELFKEDGEFLTYIKALFIGVNDFNLTSFDGVYNRYSSWVNIEQNIMNEGKFRVKGTDYDVIFRFKDKSGKSVPSTKTIAGVDLEPGETFTYSFQLEGYTRSAYDHALTWEVIFNQKRGDTLKDLLKKAKFSGTEYSDFVKAMAKEKKNKNKK